MDSGGGWLPRSVMQKILVARIIIGEQTNSDGGPFALYWRGWKEKDHRLHDVEGTKMDACCHLWLPSLGGKMRQNTGTVKPKTNVEYFWKQHQPACTDERLWFISVAETKPAWKTYPVVGICIVYGDTDNAFLPWTQNISAKGYVTTRSPTTSAGHSIGACRTPGEMVRAGRRFCPKEYDRFHFGNKSEYFDPDILERTSEQVAAKSQSIEAYDQRYLPKSQYTALQEGLMLKRNKPWTRLPRQTIKSGSTASIWLRWKPICWFHKTN